MTAARPTTLQLAARHCPHAVTLTEQGATYAREVFHVGTAAHEYLEAAAKGIPDDAVTARLMATGREGDDAEPPLPADAILQGRLLAREWLAEHPIPDGAHAEVRHAWSVPAWTPAEWDDADLRTRVDLEWLEDAEDDDGGWGQVAVVQDYKSSWAATENELDTTQRAVQLLAMWDAYPDAAGVRVQIANLRRRSIYARTYWRGADDATVEAMRSTVAAMVQALQGPRRAAPGPRCMGCPVVLSCEHAAQPADDPIRRYLQARAVADALEVEARAAVGDDPVSVDGFVVGPQTQVSRTARPDVARLVVESVQAHTGTRWGEEAASVAEGLLSMLDVSTTSLRALAKRLTPGRGTAAVREALLDAWTAERPSSRWTVRREAP